MVGAVLAASLTACGGAGDGGPPGSQTDEPGAESEAPTAEDDRTAPPSLRGRAPAATGGIPSVVTLTPVDGARDASGLAGNPAAPARGDAAVVDQFGLAFSPRVLIVGVGEPVRFTNSEGAISHNVHVRSIAGDSTVFNGDTGPGDGVDIDLVEPGGYDVLCDMHPGMTGFVFVTDAPLAVAAETDGSFLFRGLPDGAYEARAWNAGSGFGEPRRVSVSDRDAELDLTNPLQSPSDG